MNLQNLSRRSDLNSAITDQQIQASLQVINGEYLSSYFKRLVIESEKRNFFAETILTTNLLEMAIEMVAYFTSSQQVKYYVIHLIDRFYAQHIKKVIEEYRSLTGDEKANNSWTEILFRLRRQISLRLVTCIFIAIKYNHQRNGLQMEDYLFVLSKYDYYCDEKRFLRSQQRVLSELAYQLNIVTLLDVVLFLQSLLKYNIELDTQFYFPHIYDLIDLVYDTELRANERGRLDSIYFQTPRTFKLFACLVLCLVPLLTRHDQTKQVSFLSLNLKHTS